MPRNEEEVMRNIITLSNELKFSRDLPQVMISFDEQTEEELIFTVIWMRLVKLNDLGYISIQEIFERKESFLKFIPDRVKKVGLLRKKHPKEVTVFRVKLSLMTFLRSDHSVDLFKARQCIVRELQRLLGEFRDYNGGMIAKQHEQFFALKNLLPAINRQEELLLENFFHSIFPVALRGLFNPQHLKNLFSMFLEGVQKNRESKKAIFLKKTDATCCYLLFSYDEPSQRQWTENLKALPISSSQLLTLSLQASETFYLGYIYLEGDREKQNSFLKKMII